MSQQKSKGSTQVRVDPFIGNAAGGLLYENERLFHRPEALPSLYQGIDPYRQQGLQNVAGIAGGGGAVVPNTLNEFNKVMSGGYLNAGANPYLQDIVARSVGAAQAGPLSSMRMGSGIQAQALADAGASTAARLYGDQYEAERQRMAQLVGLAPQTEQLAYSPATQLMNVGSAYEADRASQQEEAVRQFMWPYMQQQIYGEQLAGNPLMAATLTKSRGESMGMDWGAMIGGILAPKPSGGGK